MRSRCFIIHLLSASGIGVLTMTAALAGSPAAAPAPRVTLGSVGQVYAHKGQTTTPPGFWKQHGWWYLGPVAPLSRSSSLPPTYAMSSADRGGPNPMLGPPPLFAGPPPVYAGPPPIVSFGLTFQ
ncbi:MAG: hypothetical protein PHT60_13290 [Acidiphilium sp.]|nr:hypothetical protein [Acidiphilium sp.]MDD4936737.1 hypothetical protein [Acidiphilium sp.]